MNIQETVARSLCRTHERARCLGERPPEGGWEAHLQAYEDEHWREFSVTARKSLSAVSDASTRGYATLTRDGILVDTVSSTEIGAIVNYLYTYKRVMITNDFSDDQIRNIWNEQKGETEVVPVGIQVASN